MRMKLKLKKKKISKIYSFTQYRSLNKCTGTKTDILLRCIMGNVHIFSSFESHSKYLA